MDRALVEIMLTVSTLCVMSLAIASAYAQYGSLATVMAGASSEEMHYSVVRGIMDAASEAKIGGSSVSIVLMLPSKIAISAVAGNVSTTCLGENRSYAFYLDVSGGGFSNAFNITGTPDGRVTVTPME